jgi:tetratricopeptide (TPR) repeat protein
MDRPGRIRALVAELRRRRVFRVAAAYAVVAFITLQAADLVFPALDLPAWTMTLLVVLALFGFPLAVVLAWAFELTPEGVRRDPLRSEAPKTDAAPAVVAPAQVRRAGWFVMGILVAGTAGWYGVQRVGGGAADDDALSASAVAVLPFRVAGADPALAYLREGMVDLMAAKLTGDWGPHAVDPRTTLSAWRRAVPREEEDLTAESAAALGRSLGAARVLLGEVVSMPGRLIVTASLVDSRSGRVGAPVSVDGPLDSLPALVDRLTATMLTREAGEADHRLAAATSTSLPALRAYLRARAEYRAGRFDQALEGFRQALAEDTTFALAAMGATRAAGWVPAAGFDDAQALSAAWRHRDRLSGRDLTVLEAIAGPRYPEPRSARERLEAWERVAQQSSDDPEGWYEVGDVLFHYVGFFGDDALDRAVRAFQRAYDLDPSFGPVRLHLFDAAMLRGDTAVAHPIARAHLEIDPSGFYGMYMEFVLAHAERADRPDRGMREWIEERADVRSLVGFMVAIPAAEAPAEVTEPQLEFADRAAVLAPGQATTLEERRLVADQQRRYALNRGRTAQAVRATRQVGELAGDPLLEHLLNVLAGLYWDGDTDAASRGIARLEQALADAGGPAALAATEGGHSHLCAIAHWRLAHGRSATGPELAAAIRSTPDGRRPSRAAELCAELVEAWAAHLDGRPEADAMIRRLDRTMGDGLTVGELTAPINLALSRLLETLGDVDGAYAAARRVPVLPSGDRYGTTLLREQGRLAMRMDRVDLAERAYLQYLRFHSDPDPGPAADAVERVRQELARRVESR